MPPDAEGDVLARLRQPALLRFASDRLPWQRSLRWERPPINWRLLLACLLLAILATVTELVGFGFGMRRQIAHELRPAPPRVIDVVLIEPKPELPIPAEPVPPPFQRRPSRIKVEAPKVELPPPPATSEESDAMRARIGSEGAPAVQLFNPDGSVRLQSAPLAPKQAPANPQEAGRQRWAEMEKRGDNPLDCKRTRFAGAYARDESLGDKVSRKYLKWIGLGDGEAIEHRARQRAERAAEGCEPVH